MSLGLHTLTFKLPSLTCEKPKVSNQPWKGHIHMCAGGAGNLHSKLIVVSYHPAHSNPQFNYSSQGWSLHRPWENKYINWRGLGADCMLLLHCIYDDSGIIYNMHQYILGPNTATVDTSRWIGFRSLKKNTWLIHFEPGFLLPAAKIITNRRSHRVFDKIRRSSTNPWNCKAQA